MTLLVTVGANAEASGHPTECTEPAPGTVQEISTSSVTVSPSSGGSSGVATVSNADIHFNSHAHAYTDEDNDGKDDTCTDLQSHDIDPNDVSDSITINGSPAYIFGSGVGTDPGSGGNVDFLDSGDNSSVEETP